MISAKSGIQFSLTLLFISLSLILVPFSHKAFAISLSNKGKPLCERSYKLLRGTSLPITELKSVDVRHKIIWKLFADIRYRNDQVSKWVPKFQSLIRMRQSRRRWLKAFNARKLFRDQERQGKKCDESHACPEAAPAFAPKAPSSLKPSPLRDDVHSSRPPPPSGLSKGKNPQPLKSSNSNTHQTVARK